MSTELRERTSKLSDEDLIKIVITDPAQYKQEAIDFANNELRRRGISLEEAERRVKAQAQTEVASEESITRNPANSRLYACPDCQHFCSRRAAVCPSCGCPLREDSLVVQVERKGWVSTIAYGILWAAVLPWLVAIALIVLIPASARR